MEDTGAGMEADFIRNRLFRPFDSTKGAKGMGIGAYQVREYIRLLGVTWKCRAVPDREPVLRLACRFLRARMRPRPRRAATP